MMNGIEILNQTQISEWVWKIHVGWIIFFAVIIFLGAIVLGAWLSNYIDDLGMLVTIFVSIIGIVILIYVSGQNVETDKYEYQVKISEEVKINEFNERYKIIKQEGKIYTIRFKD